MESQMYRTQGREYDDPLRATGTNEEEREHEHGGETKSAMKKVKEKVEKLKDKIKHGHGREDHKDEAHILNDLPVVRSGLVQPTVMGTPVLAEDLYATHSDIVDPPVRSFAQWEEEEKHGDPPPLSTGTYGTHPTDLSQFGHHPYNQQVENKHQSRDNIKKSTTIIEDPKATTISPSDHYTTTRILDRPIRPVAPMEEEKKMFMDTGIYGTHPTDVSQVGHNENGQDVNKERSIGGIGKSTSMEEDPNAPNTTTASPANYQTKVTDPTNTSGKEVGITEVLRSFDKMGVYDHEPHSRTAKPDQEEHEVFTGSHDQFAPSPPLDTIAADPSNKNSSYSQKIKSTTSAVTDKAIAVKDSIVSKLSPSGVNKTDTRNKSHEASTMPSSATDYAHIVADTLSATLGPVYEKVAGAGSSVMSKMQGSEHVESPVTTRVPESKVVTVKEYLVNTFKPGDDDKVLSEKITNVFHRGKRDVPIPKTTIETTTTYVIRDEGERRLQESGN